MDLVHSMDIFVRVVELGSFTAAADSLGHSTPHVSRSVSELENHLKARLINRTTRKLALTEVGRRYLERCKSILDDLRTAEMEAAGAHLEAFGKLRLHAPNGIGQYHIIPLVSQYSELYPSVDFELTLSHATPDLLAEGYDLLISGDSNIPDSGFIAQGLGATYSVLCAGPGYLARNGVPRSIAELSGHTCLQLDDPAFPGGWEVNGSAIDVIASSRRKFQVNVADGIAQAAREDMGICLIPLYVAAASIRRGELVRVLPDLIAHQRNVSVIYPSRQFLDAKVRTFIDYLKNHLPGRLAADEEILLGGAGSA